MNNNVQQKSMEKREVKCMPTFESEGDQHEEIALMLEEVQRDAENTPELQRYITGINDMYRFFDNTYRKNVELLQKCQEQTANVVLNASKIKAILNATLNNKDNLDELKVKYEEATKIIKQIHESEEKSKSYIVTLRDTVTQLSEQVKHGAAFSYGDENSLAEIAEEVKKLKQEKERDANTIKDLQRQIQETTNSFNDLHSEIENLTNTEQSLNKTLATIYANLEELTNVVSSTSDEILRLKPIHQQSKQDFEEGKRKKIQNTDTNTDLRNKRYEMISTLNVLKDKNHATKDRILTRSKLLIELKNKSSIRKDECLHSKEKIDKSMDEIKDLQNKFAHIVNETENTQIEYDNVQKESQELAAKKGEVKRQSRQLRSTLIDKSFNVAKSQNDISQTERKNVSTIMGIEVERKNILEERLNTHEVKEQGKNIRTETVFLKEDLQKLKESILLLFDEVDQQRSLTMQFQAKAQMSLDANNQILLQSRAHQEELDEYNEKQSHQNDLSDQLRKERNDLKRKLVSVTEENENLIEQIKILDNEITQNKSDAKVFVNNTINDHLQCRLTNSTNDDIEKTNERLRNDTLSMERVISRLQTQRQTLDFILTESEHDRLQIKKETATTIGNIELSRKAIHERDVKIEEIRSDILTIERHINKSREVYVSKLQQLVDFRNELDSLDNRTQTLEERRDKVKQRKYELKQIQTDLLLERQKYSALLHEFSVPRNVHRWEVISAVDPQYASNLRYRAEVTGKIDRAHNMLIELTKEKETLQKSLAEMKKKLSESLSKSEVLNRIEIYKKDIEMKDEQMKTMREQIGGNQTEMYRSISSIDQLRGKVTEKRGATAVIRSRSNIVSMKMNQIQQQQNQQVSDGWFITQGNALTPTLGGGWVSNVEPQKETRDIDSTSDLTVKIEQPQSYRTKKTSMMVPSMRLTKPKTPHVKLITPLNKY
ncbi:hypothetical protein TVAG_362010 [Trichomonas vaginalis G3]|uniref:Uncharacterized protein n=1 Tax=Trichomonas vaginalis (strain ATCC PRA-98 / G3) TaxID=412133 RepID=A2FRB9_TRIV3|nr:cilia- and flagella-associated protein 58-related family [Trichomonas vaginalis G3]EAX92560.1 hypothetical protein TVAG_362010 [Trichomonas vaginalis G3]KAI5538055.1 cilia- and flagella-associated protein 58-related family [Trichomonas vaginalis G3]|eukprot:XP_001305490.1 hypothetical protein [Trichomonas vaginalis G3]